MKKIAVILSGCGHLDGTEINEAVFTILAINKFNAEARIFAPNIEQSDVINHLDNTVINQKRNIFIESSRIARGNINTLDKLKVKDFDALVTPGGFGVAKNLSNITSSDQNFQVISPLKELIISFFHHKKPIGAICIAPALIACALHNITTLTITLGNKNKLLDKINANQVICDASNIVIDKKNKVISTPAFMTDENIHNIYLGIEKLIAQLLEIT